jgi:2-oxoglutarate ferredoxin oxidoreductase subunit alpha
MIDIDVDDGADVAVLAYGATARPAKGAVLKARAAGRNVGFIRPVTIWPFPVDQVRNACRNLERLLVPEMNLGQLSREIERHVDCEVVPLPKIGGVVHTSREIVAAITEAD